ncbi:MAG: hypothetical protein ACD_45C00326G0003 [uncultured bacterium]|nr:MAG: hypothetical protein ACD_45C00326G0003 [uncultured bacterium]
MFSQKHDSTEKLLSATKKVTLEQVTEKINKLAEIRHALDKYHYLITNIDSAISQCHANQRIPALFWALSSSLETRGQINTNAMELCQILQKLSYKKFKIYYHRAEQLLEDYRHFCVWEDEQDRFKELRAQLLHAGLTDNQADEKTAETNTPEGYFTRLKEKTTALINTMRNYAAIQSEKDLSFGKTLFLWAEKIEKRLDALTPITLQLPLISVFASPLSRGI